MLKATKKVYMSILAILLVFITVVATTFAWVGILTYAQTDIFNLNLKTQDLNNEYYLSISTSGVRGTYSDTAKPVELKKQILINMGMSESVLDTNEKVEYEYNKRAKLSPVTATKTEILQDTFHELNYNEPAYISLNNSRSFYKFDLYLTIEHQEGDAAITPETNVNFDVILADIEKTLIGDISKINLINKFKYNPSNMATYGITTNINTDDEIDGFVSIDTASAARLAIAVYEPIPLDDSYDDSYEVKNFKIYQGGTQNPTYYENEAIYSFGGILPEEYNLALFQHKKNRNIGANRLNVPDSMINRGDLELVDQNRELIASDDNFGIKDGVKKKVKLTIYFWFEGWDADCFEIIDGNVVNINLSFAAGSKVLL